MPNDFEIKVSSPDLLKVMNEVAKKPAQIENTLVRIVKWGTMRVLREVKIMVTGRATKVRSGTYRASINVQYPDKFTGIVGTSKEFPGGRVREYGTAHLPGGVLRPKKGRWLSIPLPAALTGAGVARNARDYDDAFFYWTESGQLLLVQRNDDTGFTPLFLMKKSVKQEGEKPFRLAYKIAEPEVLKYATQELAKLL